MSDYWKASREWEGEDVFIIGGGPSLKGFDASILKGRRVIAVNNSYLLAPWADVLYWGDAEWYGWNKDDLKKHTGKYKITRQRVGKSKYDVKLMRYAGTHWSPNPDTLGGRDSGHSAINLAYHFGVKRIFLLGFDMKQTGGENNWHDLHKKLDMKQAARRYERTFIPGLEKTARILRDEGVKVYNCNPDSALRCFKFIDVHDALNMQRQFAVVTTCHRNGFKEYGARMVRSFDEMWPSHVPLYLYAEGFKIWVSERVHVFDLHQKCRDLVRFKQQWINDKEKTGRASSRLGGKYDYRFDAVRFSHKVFAVADAVERSREDALIWMDADTLTHSRVTQEFLDGLLEDETLAWMERDREYPECGFYVLNLETCKPLIREFKKLYTSGKLFEYKEWHDCYVLEQLVNEMGVKTRSLSGRGRRTNHPLVNGPLSACFDHLKGRYKGRKRSPAQTPEKAAHWR